MNREAGTQWAGYTVAEFERMMAQEDFVMLSEWDGARGRMRMLCELDPNAWFQSGCLIWDVQERLENTPEMPFGAYRLEMRAGRGALPTLKNALPAHMAGAVEPDSAARRTNEFLVTFKQDPAKSYYKAMEDVPDFEEPLSADEAMAGHLRRLRERPARRARRSDSARIQGRMRITTPGATAAPRARRAAGRIFLLAALASLIGIALFSSEPQIHALLASIF